MADWRESRDPRDPGRSQRPTPNPPNDAASEAEQNLDIRLPPTNKLYDTEAQLEASFMTSSSPLLKAASVPKLFWEQMNCEIRLELQEAPAVPPGEPETAEKEHDRMEEYLNKKTEEIWSKIEEYVNGLNTAENPFILLVFDEARSVVHLEDGGDDVLYNNFRLIV
jgi:hypothetical protein